MNHPEEILQKNICQFLQLHKIYFFSCPNELAGGGKNAKIRTGRFVSLGLKKGVADLILWLGSETIYMEVKTPTGRQSDAQKRFQKRCEDSGRTYVVVRSVEEVEKIIRAWKEDE